MQHYSKSILIMARVFIFSLVLLSLIISHYNLAQCDTVRYQNPICETYTTYENVKYGEATVWNIPYNNTDLYMNVYTPNNDTLSKRPLMIWVHSGGFLNGNKEHDDIVALCDSFVKRGYVTATIDYRKGFNPTSSTSAERAVYRGVQDLRAAIRYLKEHHITYGIDTNYTFIGGSSAGAFSTLQLVYMEQYEAPPSIGSGIGYPALGCLDCEGNNYVHNMDISGYVALWGAVGDSNWVSPHETTPGLLIHGTTDGTVPYGVGHPFGVPTTPITHGTRSVANQLSALNIPYTTYIVEGEGHEFHGASNGTWNNPPTAYYDTIFNLINTHYSEILRQEVQPIIGDDIVCPFDTIIYEINIPVGFTSCWEVDNATIIESNNNQVKVVVGETNPVSIKSKQYSEIAAYNGTSIKTVEVSQIENVNFIYFDDNLEVSFILPNNNYVVYYWDFGDGSFSSDENPIHNYGAAGEYEVTLTIETINGCIFSKTKVINIQTSAVSEETFEYKIYPNPASDEVHIYTNNNILSIALTDLNGRVVFDDESINTNQILIKLNQLEKGIYFLNFNGGEVVEKIVVN